AAVGLRGIPRMRQGYVAGPQASAPQGPPSKNTDPVAREKPVTTMASPTTFRNKTRWGAPWTVAELRQLGKVPDSVLARRRGRTIKEVVAERIARRIGLATGPRRWTARELRFLGT